MIGHNGNEPVVEINNVVKSFSAGRTEITILKQQFSFWNERYLSI